MEVVKKTKEFTVVKKRSGRYGVKNAADKWINGDEKVKILLAEGLIKAAEPKVEEAPAEEEAPAAEEAATEDAPAEEAATE